MCSQFCGKHITDNNYMQHQNEEDVIDRGGILQAIKGCPTGFHSGKDVVFPAEIEGGQKVLKKA